MGKGLVFAGAVVLGVALAACVWLFVAAFFSAVFWVLFWALGVEGGVEIGAVTVSYPIVCGCAVAALRMVASAARSNK